MASQYLQNPISLELVQRQLRGQHPNDVMEAGEKLGLLVRQLQVTWNDLRALTFPALLWRQEDWIVMYGIKGNRLIIANPTNPELNDLRLETSVGEARVDASETAKQLQDFPAKARRLKSNNRAIREEIRNDLVQQASSAKEKYMGTLGLDSSGQPRKLTPSPSPASEQPKQRSGLFGFVQDHVPGGDKLVNVVDKGTNLVKDAGRWTVDKAKSGGNFVKDHAEDFGHGALDAAGFIPFAGAAFDGANAAWYLAKGDKVNAALSAASAIPFAGDALAAGKLGFKAVKGAEKLAEASTIVSKATKGADEGVEGVASIGKKYTFDTTNIGATPGKPLTSHQKKKTWRAMAEDSKAPLTDAQRDHIRTTPRHKSPAPSWHNPVTGKKEIMELSHEGNTFSKEVEEVSSRRAGGTDVVPRWPETHAQIDKHRHLARNVREVYTSPDGISKVRRAFVKELKEWGYKVDDSKL